MSNNKTVKIKIKNTDQLFDVPVDGSLGLLALGYKGLMLWREKRTTNEKSDGR